MEQLDKKERIEASLDPARTLPTPDEALAGQAIDGLDTPDLQARRALAGLGEKIAAALGDPAGIAFDGRRLAAVSGLLVEAEKIIDDLMERGSVSVLAQASYEQIENQALTVVGTFFKEWVAATDNAAAEMLGLEPGKEPRGLGQCAQALGHNPHNRSIAGAVYSTAFEQAERAAARNGTSKDFEAVMRERWRAYALASECVVSENAQTQYELGNRPYERSCGGPTYEGARSLAERAALLDVGERASSEMDPETRVTHLGIDELKARLVVAQEEAEHGDYLFAEELHDALALAMTPYSARRFFIEKLIAEKGPDEFFSRMLRGRTSAESMPPGFTVETADLFVSELEKLELKCGERRARLCLETVEQMRCAGASEYQIQENIYRTYSRKVGGPEMRELLCDMCDKARIKHIKDGVAEIDRRIGDGTLFSAPAENRTRNMNVLYSINEANIWMSSSGGFKSGWTDNAIWMKFAREQNKEEMREALDMVEPLNERFRGEARKQARELLPKMQELRFFLEATETTGAIAELAELRELVREQNNFANYAHALQDQELFQSINRTCAAIGLRLGEIAIAFLENAVHSEDRAAAREFFDLIGYEYADRNDFGDLAFHKYYAQDGSEHAVVEARESVFSDLYWEAKKLLA